MARPATLIRNGWVVSMDATIGIMRDTDVLIVNERIDSVGRNLAAPEDAEIVDATGMIVTPGLINAHMHMWQTALRGTAGNMTLREYFSRIHEKVGLALTPEDTHVATLIGGLNQLSLGVTTVFDWHHANHSIEHTDAAVEAHLNTGIRAVYGHGTSRKGLDTTLGAAPSLRHPRDRVERLRRGRLMSDDARVTMAMCILGPGLSPLDVVAHDVMLARDLGVPWSLHTGALGMTAVCADGIRQMSDLRLLGPDGDFVHAINYTDDELKIILNAGASVTVAPEVEMQFGHGVPATGRVIAQGGTPAIGVDLEALHSGDMFLQMRAALQSQRGFDNMAQAKPIAALSSRAADALHWATLGNARAIGLSGRIGSLTPGKQADVILVRADDLNLLPVNDPVQSLVFHANGGNVDTVYVAGECMKRHGALTGNPAALLKQNRSRMAESGRRLAALI